MSYDKTHDNDIGFRNSIDTLLNTIMSIYDDYHRDITKRFMEIGIGETPESADTIITVIDRWCVKNNEYIAPSTKQFEV
jgi:hypothetical protein